VAKNLNSDCGYLISHPALTFGCHILHDKLQSHWALAPSSVDGIDNNTLFLTKLLTDPNWLVEGTVLGTTWPFFLNLVISLVYTT
jgi:hypothetical protein